MTFVEKGSGLASEWELYQDGETRRMSFVVNGGTPLQETTFGPLPTSTWFFTCAWYDASTASMYVQCNMNAPLSQAATPSVGLNPLTLGGQGFGAGGFLDGRIDEAAIFNRVLTVDERAELYSIGLTLIPVESARIMSISFSEGGPTVTNRGTLAGAGTLAQRDGFPISSPNVPAGPLAPADNFRSIDFGAILEAQDRSAIDFTNVFGALGDLTGFTICGWVNATDLRAGSGGNRIVFAPAEPNGRGFDLVQRSDGALQLGVKQWADESPATSSQAMITEDPRAGIGNWVYFALTYDGARASGNVNFYFGKSDYAARLNATDDYDRGPIVRCGALTIGNLGIATGERDETGPSGGSWKFRGLMDEINIFDRVLTLAEIQSVQKAPARSTVMVAPTLSVSAQTGGLKLEWEMADSLRLQAATSLSPADWTNLSAPPEVNGARASLTVPITGAIRFFRLWMP
jgi:hypothetical protein